MDRKIALIACIILILAFLMPWFVPSGRSPLAPEHLLPAKNNIAGFEAHKYGHALSVLGRGKLLGNVVREETPLYLYLVWLLPVLGIFCIIRNILGRGKRLSTLVLGGLPVAGFVWLVSMFGSKVFDHLTYGAYLFTLSGLGLVVIGLLPRK